MINTVLGKIEKTIFDFKVTSEEQELIWGFAFTLDEYIAGDYWPLTPDTALVHIHSLLTIRGKEKEADKYLNKVQNDALKILCREQGDYLPD